MHIVASTTYEGVSVDLFSITLDNLSYYRAAESTDTDKKWSSELNIYYSSETGLLFYNFGDSPIKLLSFQESVSTGERLVYSMASTKFRWPGRFTRGKIDNANTTKIATYTIDLSAYITYANGKGDSGDNYCDFDLYDPNATDTKQIDVNFSGRSRTNVI